MAAAMRIEGGMLSRLEEQLAAPECAAFLLAEVAGSVFNLVELRLIEAGNYERRSSLHLTLQDEVRPQLISWAWARDLSLVEAHSHRPGHAKFSRSDLWGFDEWVPHLWWRLQGRPYAALVKSCEQWDGLAWLASPDEPEQVSAIEVVEPLESPQPHQPIQLTGTTLTTIHKGAK
jgi:hypothetical protein